jgi:site-specific DNA-methyltransferase (adenine-specific)
MMIEKNRTYLGDCLEVMKQIEDNSIDMVFCDPPYGCTCEHWDNKIDLSRLWPELERIAKNDACIVFTATQPYTSELIVSGAHLFRYEIIWEKHHPTGHMFAPWEPLKAHENILVFSKGGTRHFAKIKMKFNPQKTKGKPYAISQMHKTSIYEKWSGKVIDQINTGDRHPRSVIKINNPRASRINRTQKPVELLEYLIKQYSNEGDLILDPCGGGGTTAIAAMNLNRDYILIEKCPEMFKNMNKRIENNHTLFTGRYKND